MPRIAVTAAAPRESAGVGDLVLLFLDWSCSPSNSGCWAVTAISATHSWRGLARRARRPGLPRSAGYPAPARSERPDPKSSNSTSIWRWIRAAAFSVAVAAGDRPSSWGVRRKRSCRRDR